MWLMALPKRGNWNKAKDVLSYTITVIASAHPILPSEV